MVTKFKGHWKWSKYNPKKLAKYQIKKYGTYDSFTDYARNILTYFGTSTYNSNMAEVDMSKKISLNIYCHL